MCQQSCDPWEIRFVISFWYWGFFWKRCTTTTSTTTITWCRTFKNNYMYDPMFGNNSSVLNKMYQRNSLIISLHFMTMRKLVLIFLRYRKYSKFWNVFLEHFMKDKPFFLKSAYDMSTMLARPSSCPNKQHQWKLENVYIFLFEQKSCCCTCSSSTWTFVVVIIVFIIIFILILMFNFFRPMLLHIFGVPFSFWILKI